MAESTVLYHTTPARKLASILAHGVLPELSRGAQAVVWLHARGRLGWALGHVAHRHGTAAVVSLRVLVPRAWLTRRRRGVWTCARPVPPGMIQAVNVVGLIQRAAA
jgi:hypothetical protein